MLMARAGWTSRRDSDRALAASPPLADPGGYRRSCQARIARRSWGVRGSLDGLQGNIYSAHIRDAVGRVSHSDIRRQPIRRDFVRLEIGPIQTPWCGGSGPSQTG